MTDNVIPLSDGPATYGYLSIITRLRWCLIEMLAGRDAICLNMNDCIVNLKHGQSLFISGDRNEVRGDGAHYKMIKAGLT